jgi:hypothetical protein
MTNLIEYMDLGTSLASGRMSIELCESKTANAFFKEYHYLRRARRSKKLCYEVFIGELPVGFLEFSYPIWSHRAGIIPPYKPGEVVELSRCCLIDNAPKNSESCAISKAILKLKNDWLAFTKIPPKLIISYSDRERGHQGGIYKAANFQVIATSHTLRHRHGSLHHPRPYSTGTEKMLYARALA